MNKPFVLHSFNGAEKVSNFAGATGVTRDLAEQSIASASMCCDQSLSSAQEGAKAFAEVAETFWGSAKLLHMRLLQNMAEQTQAMFGIARAITQANSLHEVAELQSNLWMQVFATTSEQANEFVDLSTRASEHVAETILSAATRPINSRS